MKSLFDEVNSWNLADNFELLFQINNIQRGWNLVNKLETTLENKNFLVRYTALAYSYNSKLLRSKRDRLENKLNIVSFLGVELDEFTEQCIHNKNQKYNKFVTWWLKESEDREFAIIISGEDLLYDLLETARDGVERVVTAKDDKAIEKAMRTFVRMEVIAKAEAYKQAMEIKDSLERQIHILEKNYDYVAGFIKDEIDDFDMNLPLRERLVLRHKQRNK